MKVIIPMSGEGSRFRDAGYTSIKPLIYVEGKPMIYHVMDIFPGSEFVFIHNKDHDVKFLSEFGKLVSIQGHKLGPVQTLLSAEHDIPDEEEIIVSYCDYGTKWDFERFLNMDKPDGVIAGYTGFHPHMLGTDHYAYMKHDNMRLIDIQEKKPFTDDKMSEYASNGTYYFKSGALLKKYCKKLVESRNTVNDEYYVSMVFKEMLKDNIRVDIFEIDKMLQWGTPKDLEEYEMWASYFTKKYTHPLEPPYMKGVKIIPMAGKGSRFFDVGYRLPKPFIPVDGKPMIERAIECLPKTDKTIIIKLDEHEIPVVDADIISIPIVTNGQATTCYTVTKNFDETPVLISACDNGVYYDSHKVNFEDDIIVWAFDNHPTSKRYPHMYAWLDVDENNYIKRVSVKKAFDGCKYAIIGTMYFKRAKIFNEGYNYIVDHNIRTNGEFYVDDMLQPLINAGYRVKMFVVDYYLCWGTPNDYKTYEYWNSYFTRKKLVICDMDDTIVNYKEAHKYALEQIGLDLSPARDELYKMFDGMFLRHDKLIQIKNTLKTTYPKEIYKVYKKYRQAYINKIDYMPNAKQFLETCKLPLVIMSNNNLDLQLEVIDKLDIKCTELFTSNEFLYDKPDKTSLEFIMNKYNVNVNDIISIGDSISDFKWSYEIKTMLPECAYGLSSCTN